VSIDDQLRRALATRNAPAGFGGRTMNRIASAQADARLPPSGSPTSARRMPIRRPGLVAVAASLVLAVGAGRYVAHRQAAREAERARHEVEVALKVVSRTLNTVQLKVAAAVQRTGADHEPSSR
jgi:hypothetical protein